ncbi:MAG TPA: TIGR03118 family protein, partial [Candidatus Limnocylindria bacterium]|nr:TIGR03118 family protein [Candidatus Limnocylindria bacterium]
HFHDDLLVGNFGDGRINGFDLASGAFTGQLGDGLGGAIQIDGLWGLRVGNGGRGGDPNFVYFAAGLNDEADGLFGSIQTLN